MTYALGESWCSDGTTASCNNYELLWAKEFRYDGARARYLVGDLNTTLLLLNPPIVQHDSTFVATYDGDNIVKDSVAEFESGIARVQPLTTGGGANTMYYHTDHLGTTRLMTGPDGNVAPGWYGTSQTDVQPSVYTAFGERIAGPSNGTFDRYGYVGAYGYQAHDYGEIPFLHVGARYYDPRSGRFLQREPIGITGGGNVYLYANAEPTAGIDPRGFSISSVDAAVLNGTITAAERAALLGLGVGAATVAEREAQYRVVDIVARLARNRAKKAAERAINRAKEAFRRNRDFKKYVERNARKIPRGKPTNPDLPGDAIRELYEEWRALGCPGR